MIRVAVFSLGACIAATACGEPDAQPSTAHAQADVTRQEAADLRDEFEGLCRITLDVHIEAPAGGNRSTVNSNGTKITVLGSRSQSLSTVNGKAEITVTGASVLHLNFPDGELASVETQTGPGRITVTIDGPSAISCRQAG